MRPIVPLDSDRARDLAINLAPNTPGFAERVTQLFRVLCRLPEQEPLKITDTSDQADDDRDDEEESATRAGD